MKDCYSSSEIIDLAGVGIKAIEKAARENRIKSIRGQKLRNGKHEPLYLFSSLPQKWQDKIIASEQIQRAERLPVAVPDKTPAVINPQPSAPDPVRDIMNEFMQVSDDKKLSFIFYSMTTEKSRKIAYAREALLSDCKRYQSGYKNKTDALAAFVDAYNNGTVKTQDPVRSISCRNVYSWEKKYQQHGITGLLPEERGVKQSLPAEAVRWILAQWLDQNKPAMTDVWRVFIEEFPHHSDIQFDVVRRILNKVPPYVRDYFREGKKHFNDRYMPYAQRDYSTLKVNQIWVSDGHTFDVHVVDPRSGRPAKPTLVSWMDVRSRKILGFAVDASENKHMILESIALSIRNVHSLPECVYLDNGSAFNAKIFTDETAGLYPRLGILVRNAQPYHGQSKPIERFHKTLKEKFSKRFLTYTGGRPHERPERQQDMIKSGKCPQLAEFIAWFAEWVEIYNNTPHKGDAMNGRTPAEVYETEERYVRELDDTMLLDMLPEHPQAKRFGRNGISLNGTFYYNPDLVAYVNKTVRVRYSLSDMETVYIFDLDGTFIGEAATKERPTWNDKEPITQKVVDEQKRVRGKLARRMTKVKKELETLKILTTETGIGDADALPDMISQQLALMDTSKKRTHEKTANPLDDPMLRK